MKKKLETRSTMRVKTYLNPQYWMCILCLGFMFHIANAQETNLDDSLRIAIQENKLPTRTISGEQMPWFLIPEVVISEKRVFRSAEEKARFLRLRHDVIKVLPYARFAQKRYEQLYHDLGTTNKRKERRELVKNCEQEIKDMFNKEVKNLTISQGKILIKLIDRQTGNSSYEVVRSLRGGVTAFFYQSIARVFGHNLKSTYDPQEDREIENIIRGLNYAF